MGTLRFIPATMDAEAVVHVDARLLNVAREHGVTIPLAIESGSRAWGFPSPDSGYDCRFIFVRSAEQYLSPWQRRDVIETPLEGILDVNGWELGKALKLLLKGNAVVIEWLTSPIIYDADSGFRDEFIGLARQFARRELIARHYLHLGERQMRGYLGGGGAVPQKKIFYALRPAMALRWLRLNADSNIAPMYFPALLAESRPPSDVVGYAAELIARKAALPELGAEPLPDFLAAFIENEFEAARAAFPKPAMAQPGIGRVEVEAFFRATVRRFSP